MGAEPGRQGSGVGVEALPEKVQGSSLASEGVLLGRHSASQDIPDGVGSRRRGAVRAAAVGWEEQLVQLKLPKGAPDCIQPGEDLPAEAFC